jgi:hypothetical protein
MAQIMYTHVYKCKNDTVETVPGIRQGRRNKGECGGSEFKCDIFDTL